LIEVHEQFTVPTGVDDVWAVLSDPYAVVECVPGAQLGPKRDDGSFDAKLQVKFGPMNVAFQLAVTVELDAAAKQGRLTARGKDNQGGARVQSQAAFRVEEHPPCSLVSVDGQVEISGRLASLIEGGAGAVVKSMSRQFGERLAARCVAAA